MTLKMRLKMKNPVESFQPLCITLTAPKHAVKQFKRTKIV